MSKKFKIVALGCRTNQYEAQAVRNQLLGLGHSQASEEEQADIYVVNSCTVTESADASSRHIVRSFIRENPEAKVIVTGCLAERDPKSLESIEGVTKVVSNKDKEFLVQALFPDEEIPEFAIKQFEAHTRAFVKVQDGCNSFCSYCIIPYVRGRSRSRSLQDILKEVQELVSNGYKEIVLTGINIGDYDGGVESTETPVRLCDLVRAVDALSGVERIRISSIDPDEVDDDLLQAVIFGKKTCKSMHVVLQAGSNSILKRMNRKYTKQIFFDTIRRLKAACPDFTFTTDIIVGFPGETEGDFEETLDAVRQVRFAKVHTFPYSSRPRTKAATFTNKVPSEAIRDRKSKLIRLTEQVSYQLRSEYIGRTMTILTESSDENASFGHTDNFLPVKIEGISIPSNQLVDVKIIGNTPESLLGEVESHKLLASTQPNDMKEIARS